MILTNLYHPMIAILLFISFNNVYSQWEIQKTNIKSTIYSLCFLDSLNGWATTDSSIYLHTSDGGKNWLIEKINNERYGVKQIQFVSKYIGYACGSLGRLFSTKDGGKTWLHYSNIFEIDFQDIFFVNENEGWAVGQRYGDNWGRGMIVHTSDGGTSWYKQLELESTNQLDVKFFKAIRMKNSNEGWAIAGDYFDNFSLTYVYKTVDGGKSWNKLSSPIKRPARRLKIANYDTLWVDGYGVAPMSTTADGGLSWNMFPNEYKYIGTVSPRSGNKGWAFYNDFRQGMPSSIVYTTDRGISWVEEIVINENIFDIENKGMYVWAAGTNGLIMRKGLITTFIDESSNEILRDFELYANYPNPFNPETTISYNLPKESDVEIKIYDALGKTIKEDFFLNQPKGKNKYVWKAKNILGNMVSAGVYFYQILVYSKNENIQKKTSKMLFLK